MYYANHHDDAFKEEINKLKTQLSRMQRKLDARDRRIKVAEASHIKDTKDLRLLAAERKNLIDMLSAENGRLKRKQKYGK